MSSNSIINPSSGLFILFCPALFFLLFSLPLSFSLSLLRSPSYHSFLFSTFDPQVLRLKVALERLFVRERENVPNVDESSSIQDHLQIPVITSTTGATVSSPLLTPDTESKKSQLQQLSPSSPSTSSTDGKLRGILKKSPASSVSNLPDDVQDKSSLDQVTGGQISDSSSSSPRTSIS